ncbi:MAG: FtsX-like permease family protein [Acidobacteria bacterium]|nr:MAG: FtsX-like permease family protein [Acidobacteriota bacterium]
MQIEARMFRESWRSLRRAPAVSLAALLTLAIGLGVSFAIFNALYAALWQPLPYPHSDQLVTITGAYGTQMHGLNVSQPAMRQLADHSPTLAGVGLYSWDIGVITGHGPAKKESVLQAAPSLFRALSIGPSQGRAFNAADTRKGAEPVMIVSAPFARQRFGAASALGQTLAYNGIPHRIVGVVSPDFSSFLGGGNRLDIFLPLPPDTRMFAGRYGAIGRLRPGITPAAATQQASALAARLSQQYPRLRSNLGPLSFDVTSLAAANRDLGAVPKLLEGAALLLLWLACVNVASVLLARVTVRGQEFAIRLALGASRARLLRQILFEGLALGTAGGVLAWWIAWAALHATAGLHLPYWMSTSAPSGSPAPLLFAALISIAAGLLCSLLPAWRAAHSLAASQQSALAPRRLRGSVIAFEVALALVLAVSSALLIRTVMQLEARPSGFNPNHLLTAQVMLPQKQFTASSNAASNLLYTQMLDRARALPGVESAALASILPYTGTMFTTALLDGHDRQMQLAMISPGYLRTMQIPLLHGRAFAATDTANAPGAVIVSHRLASQWWPDQNALGKQFNLHWAGRKGPWTVIGIAHDVHEDNSGPLSAAGRAYFSRVQFPQSGYSLVLRAHGDPAALTPPLRHLVAALAPNAVFTPQTMTGIMQGEISSQRFLELVLELAALLALALAAIGIYGTVSYWVSQRTQEMGVRLALGSSRAGVTSLVIGRALRWAVIGAIVGGAAAYAAGRSLATLLYHVSPGDPASLAIGIAILLAVALLAAWLPARRAARVNPVEALRHE